MAGKYKRLYITSGSVLATIIGLFAVLSSIGLIITSDGDKVCAGTIDDPCVSYFTVRNPTATSVYIYNKNDVKLDFSPSIKDYELYVKYYGKWVRTDFTMNTRLSNIPEDRAYVFVFPRYSKKEFKLVGYKNNPSDDVKWGFGTEKDYMDPLWEGIQEVNPIFSSNYYKKVLNYEVLDYSGELENYSMTISNTSYFVTNRLVIVNDSFNYSEEVINWDFNIDFVIELNDSEQLIPIKKNAVKLKDLSYKKEIKSNKTREKYYTRMNGVKDGEVYHFGTTSVVLNFSTADILLSNVVNDVYSYNLSSDSVSYTTWYNDNTASWWQTINDSKKMVFWNKLDNSSLKSEIGPNGTAYNSPIFAFGPAKFNNGVNNNGTNSGISVGKPITMTKGTVEAWVQHGNYGAGAQASTVIIGNEGGTFNGAISFVKYDYTAGYFLGLHVSAGEYVYLRPTDADMGVGDNDLVHYAITWDMTGLSGAVNEGNVEDYIQVYVNGVRKTLTGGTENFVGVSFDEFNRSFDKNLIIAGQSITTAQSTKGRVDNVKMYNFKKTDFSDRFYEDARDRSSSFPLKSYLVCSTGGYDIIDSSDSNLWYENRVVGSCSQIYASNGEIFLDNGTNFLNQSFRNDVFTNTKSRQNDLFVRSDEYYWTNATGFCRDNNAIDWTFTCDNYTIEQSVSSICADNNNVYIPRSNAGLSVFDTNSLIQSKHYVISSFNNTAPILWNTLNDTNSLNNSLIGKDFSVVGTPYFSSMKFNDGAVINVSSNISITSPNFSFIKGTLEMWIRPQGYSISNGVPSSGSVSYYGWYNNALSRFVQLQSTASGIVWTLRDGGIKDWTVSPALFDIGNGELAHVAFTWDNSDANKKRRIFLNGIEVASNNSAFNDATMSPGFFVLGKQNQRLVPFKGVMDNIKVYDYVKTDFSDRFVENSSKVIKVLSNNNVTGCDVGSNNIDLFVSNYGGVDQINVNTDTNLENWTTNLPSLNVTSVSCNAPTCAVGFVESGASVFTYTVSDTCTYTSGNWAVTCNDNCSISSNVAVNSGKNITISGSGTFTTSANITGFNVLRIIGTSSSNQCRVICNGGGCFK